ncbi:MAG TPA: hypothetical protein VK427_09230 [Kofleriaceae bacterium]|nr:hypothetical protein [Kofleriaceae bacterium]
MKNSTRMWMGIAAALVSGVIACSDPGGSTSDGRCGDDVCGAGETRTSCAEDCDQCGNGECGTGETRQNCEVDCDPCGNGRCEAGETPQTCAADCMPPPATCNNNVCEAGETFEGCPNDCGAKLRVQNSSSYVVAYLYMRRCTSTVWSPDLLGANVIGVNQALTLTRVPPGCWFVRATGLNATPVWVTPAGLQFEAGNTTPWTLTN